MHGIEITTASLMEAGEYFVYKNTPLEDLQRLMSDSGWGQIPVVDQNTNEVIGIVTRTDVLGVLAGKSFRKEQRDLSDLLEKALPPCKNRFIKNHCRNCF